MSNEPTSDMVKGWRLTREKSHFFHEGATRSICGRAKRPILARYTLTPSLFANFCFYCRVRTRGPAVPQEDRLP